MESLLKVQTKRRNIKVHYEQFYVNTLGNEEIGIFLIQENILSLNKSITSEEIELIFF